MRTEKKIILLLIASLIFVGCKREFGCTDNSALNYDAEIKEKNDNGSCEYSVEVIVWWDTTYAKQIINNGFSGAEVYIDNCLADYFTEMTFFIEPVCGELGQISGVQKIVDLHGISTKEIELQLTFIDPLKLDSTRTENVIISASDDCLIYQFK